MIPFPISQWEHAQAKSRLERQHEAIEQRSTINSSELLKNAKNTLNSIEPTRTVIAQYLRESHHHLPHTKVECNPRHPVENPVE